MWKFAFLSHRSSDNMLAVAVKRFGSWLGHVDEFIRMVYHWLYSDMG